MRSIKDSKVEEDETPSQVGGIAFFGSLLFLSILCPIFFRFLYNHLDVAEWPRLFWFIPGVITSFSLCTLLPERPCVFIHELKHSILSSLVGNRAKEMKIDKSSGHFKYEYTSKTAAYNAFIALAPYWLPIFLVVTLLLSISIFPNNNSYALTLVGLGVGADLFFNTKDISPHQSDFYSLRGGFTVGLWYVVVINCMIATLLSFWILYGIPGYVLLGKDLWSTALIIAGALGIKI